MARSSTPDWDSAHAAAILPGVPLPEWAISDGPYLPDAGTSVLDAPEVDLPPAQEPSPVPQPDGRRLDELSIAEMEAAFRDLVHRNAEPTPPTVSDEPESEPTPIEFARPGYPQTPDVPQVPMPDERPGYPTEAHTGSIIVPPPPPPVAFAPAGTQPTTVNSQADASYEPIRLDLPMSEVLAREFTRRGGHDVIERAGTATVTPDQIAAPIPAPIPAPVPAPTLAVPAPPAPLPLMAGPTIVAPQAPISEPAEELQTQVAPPDAPTSRRRLLVLIGIGALLALVAALAAFFLPGILDPAPSTSGTPTQNPTGTTIATSGFVLQTPATIGPYTKLAGPIDSTLRQATTASVIPGLTSPVSAVYGTGEVPFATVIAWKASSTPAPSSVSQAFAGFQSSAKTSVADIAGVSSTGLPGQMSCGETQINGTPTTLCFWADPATFGSITVVNPKTPAQGALAAAQIRAAVEVQQ